MYCILNYEMLFSSTYMYSTCSRVTLKQLAGNSRNKIPVLYLD